MLQAALDNYDVEDEPVPPSTWQMKYGKLSSSSRKDSTNPPVVSPEATRTSQTTLKGGKGRRRDTNPSSSSPLPSARSSNASLSSFLTTQTLRSSVERPPLKKSSKRSSSRSRHPPLHPPASPPPPVASSVELSASGVDLRRWIQEVQQRADDDARKCDPFGIADKKWSNSTAKSSRALPEVPFDVNKETSKVMSQLPRAGGGKSIVDKKSKKRRSQQKRDEIRNENADKSNYTGLSPPASPDADPSLSEARIILDAYSKVEKEAEKVRVEKLGRVGAEDFIAKVRKRQQESRPKPSRAPALAPAPSARDGVAARAPAPRPLALPPAPEPHPEKPKNAAKRIKTSKRAKLESMKADAELARAHETAIKIAHQRCRRRILKKCFLNFALFIMMEAQRVSNMKRVLKESKSLRIKTNILRRWRAFSSLMRTKFEKFVRVRRLKVCRGVFSTWVAVAKDNRLLLEGFYKEAEWRMKGRCFSSLVKFARNAKWKREEAAEELQRVHDAAKNDRAKRWWKSNVLSRVFVVWSVHTKSERDRKYTENCHEKRRGRVKDLFMRVNRIEVVAEEEAGSGGERSDDEGGSSGKDMDDGVKSVLVDLLEGGGGKDRRVVALRSLLDKCLQESDRGDTVGCEDDAVVKRMEEIGLSNGNNEESRGGNSSSGSVSGGRLPKNINGCDRSCAASTITKSIPVPRSVASMFSRHEERAKRRAALNARYTALNNERDKRRAELESKRKYEDAKREAAKKLALSEEKRKEELALLRKKEELERRREMWRLACMHHVMCLLGGVVMKRWKAKIGELRLKEKKADLFLSDSILSRHWKLLKEYTEVRKGLRRDLEARAARKADEYYFDALCWKVFSAWVRHMKTLKAKYRAVRGQNLFNKRSKIFQSWQSALDKERLVWWEIEKHAQIKGRQVNLRHHFTSLRGAVKAGKQRRKEDQEVERKMAEVRKWLE